MMRSMFSAISGLRNHQTYLDVVGNNIANVNTTGFKASRVTFQDILSQTLRSAAATTATQGGVNAAQVGLGSAIAGVDTILTQGNLQATAKVTDLAIQGEGYFVLKEGNGQLNYTRDGGFDRLSDGRLVNPNSGFAVQGWMANAAGVVDTAGPLSNIVIPIGQGVTGSVSAAGALMGNINSDTAVNGTYVTTMTSYDSLGGAHKTTITFTKTGPNAWSAAFAAGDTTATVAGGPVAITFDGNTGKVTTPTANQTLTVTPTGTGGAAAYPVQLDFTKLTQLVSPNDVTTTVDGAAAGGLVSFSVGKDGQVTGIYSNGLTKTLAQLAVATFQNPAGLQKAGGNNYRVSANSGAALIGTAGLGGRGEISSGFLEMSNVDLAQQFTNMIIANRGFQANSRVISTSDQMLQDLVNLNR